MDGAFAVLKDDIEVRRYNPNEMMSSLVEERKLIKIQMPYLPQVRSMTVSRLRRSLVAKRDARHYFHSLRTGKKRRRWLALPSVGKAL